MTMLKTSCSSLKSSNVPLKAIVGLKVKFAVVSHDPNDQIHLQASNKKRRYQRRGSKTPQMMANLQRNRSDGEENNHLNSLPQGLLSDSLLLQELLLLDESEDPWENITSSHITKVFKPRDAFWYQKRKRRFFCWIRVSNCSETILSLRDLSILLLNVMRPSGFPIH